VQLILAARTEGPTRAATASGTTRWENARTSGANRGGRRQLANTIGAMPPHQKLARLTAVLALGLSLGALAGGCGSETKTVSVAGAPPVAQSTSAPAVTQTASTPTATQTTPATGPTPAPASTSGGTPAPSTTRSAPEPVFTQGTAGSAAEGASAAAALLRAHGYTADDTAEYHPGQTLRVLVGTRTGSGDGYGQQAFFFVDGHYLGTDAKEPSASVKVVSQSDTEVTLAYPLYRHSDPLCCPGGGQATVHFVLDNGRLQALDPIPPASSTQALSRY